MNNQIRLTYYYEEEDTDTPVHSTEIRRILNADYPWTNLIAPYLEFLVACGFIIDPKIIETLEKEAEGLLQEFHKSLYTPKEITSND